MPKRVSNCRYYRPGDSDDEFVWRSRVAYLQAVARKDATRVVLQSLESDVLPIYRICCDKLGWTPQSGGIGKEFERREIDATETAYVGDPPSMCSWWDIERAAEDFYPVLIPLRQALYGWADRFSFKRAIASPQQLIPREWFTRCALLTLADWNFEKNHVERGWVFPTFALRNPTFLAWDARAAIQVSVTYLRYTHFGQSAQFAETILSPELPASAQDRVSDANQWTGLGDILFKLFGDRNPSRHVPFTETQGLWNPCSETLSQFELAYKKFINLISSELELEFKDHVARVKKYLAENNFEPLRSKVGAQQYDNLAAYQILGLSPDEIANRCNYSTTTSAVFKGIQRAAREIGISLRPPRRGPGAKGRA